MRSRGERLNTKFQNVYIGGQRAEAAIIDAVHGDRSARKAEKASKQADGVMFAKKMVGRY